MAPLALGFMVVVAIVPLLYFFDVFITLLSGHILLPSTR